MDGLLSVHSFFAVMETTGSTGEDISPKSSSFKQREKRVVNKRAMLSGRIARWRKNF